MFFVDDLFVEYWIDDGVVKVVCNVLFYIEFGEMFGIVGESGSGKSMFVFVIFWYLEGNGWIMGGIIEYDGWFVFDFFLWEFREFWGNEIVYVL